MTNQPNEALVEAVARGLARRNYPSGTPADIDDMWDGFADDARAIIPIVQQTVAGELAALREELKGMTRNRDNLRTYLAERARELNDARDARATAMKYAREVRAKADKMIAAALGDASTIEHGKHCASPKAAT